MAAITPQGPDTRPPRARDDTRDSHRKHVPPDDARGLWSQLTGVDVLAIPGLHAGMVHTRIADMGLDRHPWPTVKACASWLGLASRHEISGGNVRRRGTLKTGNRAGQALRLAAYAVSRSRSSLGAYDRRMRARLGPKAAIVATAHKIARMVYHNQELGVTYFDTLRQHQTVDRLIRRIERLGYRVSLEPVPAA